MALVVAGLPNKQVGTLQMMEDGPTGSISKVELRGPDVVVRQMAAGCTVILKPASQTPHS